MAEPTPLMKQYQGVKEKHSDAIVLFRLGDFYEMFGEDAKLASGILQIALTTRDKGKEDPLPMCGIPYFASETYISKLIRAGHKVAICEQVEDPREAKGIVQREVVRVISPGTHTPEHPKVNNYILSFAPEGDKYGIALADVSTGEFLVYETTKPLEDEISRVEPSEVVISESLKDNIHYEEMLKGHYVSAVSDWSFDYTEAYKALLRHFRVSSLGGYGCEAMTAAISSAGALIAYIEETQKDTVRFRKISTPNQSSYMFLDAQTQRNLELVRNLKDGSREGSLLWAMDETLTPMGGRFLRNAILRPLVDIEEIGKRLNAVGHLFEDYELSEVLRKNLRRIQDIERLVQRASAGSANARDLAAIKASLEYLPPIKAALEGSREGHLSALASAIGDFSALAALIEKSIVEHPPVGLRDGGIIRAGYSAEIDELKALSVNARDYISALEAEEKRKTGISSLKVGYNKVFGYYIEVTRANLHQVPDRYVRKQTLVGGERFITPELKELESKVLGAEERLKTLEYDAFLEILERVRLRAPELMDASESLAHLDFLLSMSVVAKRHNYVKPRVDEGTAISITNGRHPVLERLSFSERFIPNDAFMEKRDTRLLIITGPNMAGKSTYMRQVALIVLIAQMGGFVPADEAAIGIVDRIFTRIGASDYLTRGQSTFMVEMIETANILNNATEKSLILLDEVGRGTSTFDGISIAWATAEYIAGHVKARTLFATHYNELTDLVHALDGTRNYNIAVKEWGDEIIFLRKVEEGPADKSYGIQVARLAGLPEQVLSKARKVLNRLEKQHISDSASKGHKQLDLFAAKQDAVLSTLTELDLEGLTPEKALALLSELKNRVTL
jgi:DNA mismatch repair protein MutS